MRWFGRKIDALVAALLAAAVGIALSQALAFSHQYLQRLGGHRDEAERAWQRIEEGVSSGPAADIGRRRAAAEAHARYQELTDAYDAIRAAGPLSRPIVMLRRLDPDIADGVMGDFQPALPVDGASLAYGIAGMVLAVIAYDAVKWPFAATARRFRRRRPATRSSLRS